MSHESADGTALRKTPMTDIVTRLRAVFHNDRSVELMNREAADEIERLRNELAESERLLDEYQREAADRTRWESSND